MNGNLICGLPTRLFAYVTATTAVAAPLIVLALVKIAVDPPSFTKAASVALFFALGLLADLQPMPMGEGGKTDVSITTVFIVTMAILFGWHYAVPAAALSIAITLIVQRRPIERVAFNVASYSIFAFCASAPVIIFGASDSVGAGRLTAYILGGAALHVCANTLVVAGAVALSQNIRYREVVTATLARNGLVFVMMSVLAALAANLWAAHPWMLLLLAGPLFTLTLYQRSLYHSHQAAKDARTDNLSGLGNHRAYQAALRNAIIDAERDGTEFSLCIVDVDDFKRINDTYGHQVGDDVLVALAEILSNARGGEAFRCGGDEFALLFPGDGTGAFEQITDVQEAVAGLGLTPVTISVGIASFPAQADDADGLQRMADGALYWSKHHGKNRSFVYSPKVVRIHSAKELEWETERVARLRAAKNVVRFVDAKDPSTANHSETVSALAAAIGAEMGLDESTVDQLALAGLLHDIGKIGIPDSLLQAPRALTPVEFETIKAHPALGFSLLEGLGIAPIDEWILHHHENWDGTGYPDGLAGEDIPLGARIVRVADAFEAMTANRPYRSAQSVEYALAELRANAGTQFEATAVAAVEACVAHSTPARQYSPALAFA
ncbi:MAG TPA: diguanylate cyclase [Gaiellaceae bacterium]|jgi:diguanylate cyclase (GGDEF)-like protein